MWKIMRMLPLFWAAAAGLYSQTIPFDCGRWEITADSFRTLDYKGQKALYLRGGFAFVLAMATISVLAVRAAARNPVQSLRYE